MPIAFTEDNVAVLLDEPAALQVVISNEGNIDSYDIVVLILVTDLLKMNSTPFSVDNCFNLFARV